MKFRLPRVGLPMLAKELAEMAQRRRTYVVRVAFALLIFLMSAVVFLPTYVAAGTSRVGLLGQGARLLDVLYEIEWWGLCLFVPAVVSGALAAEKERNTLQLLFLTRLGPWTILLEKLLSRFVPVATFLLVSLPLLFVAYLMGGLNGSDVGFAAAGLVVTAFQLGCIALFCSAFCATTASAFVMSYVIVPVVFLFPYLVLAAIVAFEAGFRSMTGRNPAGFAWLDAPQMQPVLEQLVTATLGLDLRWVFQRGMRFGPAVLRPFHTSVLPLCVVTTTGLMFLLACRIVIVRRASPQPRHRIRRFFRWLDRGFGRLNDRYARGILLGRADDDLPEESPVAWRESRRGNLGRVNYLIRIILVVEVPILLLTVVYLAVSLDGRSNGPGGPGLLLWPIALLVVLVRSAGLIGGEKARQTLDVLLTTPLPLSALYGQKMRGLFRVMAIVSIPILVHAALVAYFQNPAEWGQLPFSNVQRFHPIGMGLFYVVMVALNLAVLLGLAAQLAFLFGLRATTQGRAVTAVLSVFVAWCFIPVILRVFAETGAVVLYFSPISGILLTGLPDLNVDWVVNPFGGRTPVRSQFYSPIHCLIYAAIVGILAWVNYVLAGRALLRPATSRLRPLAQPADGAGNWIHPTGDASQSPKPVRRK